MNHTDLLNQPLVCRLKRMRFLCLEVFVSPVEIVVMFTYTSQHLDILKLYCSFSYFFSAAPTSDRFVIHRWQQCQTSARSYFQATQFCLDENNYFIIWLPRFHLARGYPLLETWCLAVFSYTISAFPPPPPDYTGFIEIMGDVVRSKALSGAHQMDSSAEAVCRCICVVTIDHPRLSINGGWVTSTWSIPPTITVVVHSPLVPMSTRSLLHWPPLASSQSSLSS